MRWLDYLKQNQEVMDDFLDFLDKRHKVRILDMDNANTMEQVKFAQGARKEIESIRLIITMEEREEKAHAGYIERTKGR